MNWFGIVKRHYEAGRYTKEQVKVFVQAGKITEAEYQDIVGETYEE